MEKSRNNQIITTVELEKLVENTIARPLLVTQQEQLRTRK
jgi:hypothetical protein